MGSDSDRWETPPDREVNQPFLCGAGVQGCRDAPPFFIRETLGKCEERFALRPDEFAGTNASDLLKEKAVRRQRTLQHRAITLGNKSTIQQGNAPVILFMANEAAAGLYQS